MDDTQQQELAAETWGGTGIIFDVSSGGVRVEFDCAAAIIPERPVLNTKGEFDVVGQYTREGPGPIRVDRMPKPQDVRFRGKVAGKTMQLTASFVDSGAEISTFTLQRGEPGRLRKCK